MIVNVRNLKKRSSNSSYKNFRQTRNSNNCDCHSEKKEKKSTLCGRTCGEIIWKTARRRESRTKIVNSQIILQRCKSHIRWMKLQMNPHKNLGNMIYSEFGIQDDFEIMAIEQRGKTNWDVSQNNNNNGYCHRKNKKNWTRCGLIFGQIVWKLIGDGKTLQKL